MTHGSLFSGIGGFDLAAEWMGWENVFHCEWNDFGKKVLKYYWPNAISYHDIKQTDFTIHRGTIDILTGGFPCQPYSLAGQRKGKEDDRHLWPEMLRAIREIQPRWVVGENVFGLINWSKGLVFHEVQADLEAEGYEVFPFVLPAAGVGAPHRRDRVWFVAYACSDGHQSGLFGKSGLTPRERESKGLQWERLWSDLGGISETELIADTHDGQYFDEKKQIQARRYSVDYCNFRDVADPNGIQRSQRGMYTAESQTTERHACSCYACSHRANAWHQFPTQSPVCNGDDGLSTRLDFAAVFGSVKHPRQPARAFGKWRNESIKAGGNAIVPQVVHQIFQTIEAYEREVVA